jgi:hypothetical protein
MFKEPLLDFFTPVDGSPIPQQDHRPLKMPQQVFEEGSDIQSSEIACAKLEIKGQTPSFWGHCQSTDRRNSVLFVEIVKEGRLPFGGPSTSDVGENSGTTAMSSGMIG